MMEQEDNKEQVIIPEPHKQDDNDNKKVRHVIKSVIIAGALFLITIILIVFVVIFVRRRKQRRNTSSEDISYVIDEKTENRYNNILSYINEEYHSYGKEDDLSSLNTISEKDNHIYALCSRNSGYVYADISTSINSFEDTLPSSGTYAIDISIEEVVSDVEVTLDNYLSLDKTHHIYVSSLVDNKYVSFLGMDDDGSYVSATHKDYSSTNTYDVEVVNSSNKILFDLYMYMLSE